MLTPAYLAFALLPVLIHAHPHEMHVELSTEELARRTFAAEKRLVTASKCASHVARYNLARKQRRGLAKRAETSDVIATGTLSAAEPTYTTLANTTCVTAPEVTEGPYYINNEFLRTNLSETQGGVSLILDIGVMDTTTCQPLSNVLVEIWNANATGHYAGFANNEGSSSGSGKGTESAPSGNESNVTAGGSMSGSLPALGNSSSLTTGALAPSKSGAPGGSNGTAPSDNSGGTGATQGQSTNTLTETFLRGGYPTNSDGIVEFHTIYPGFYTGRTAHIHAMIHTNYSIASNGTIISHAGSVIHIGQIFFEEEMNLKVFNTSIYSNTSMTRTYNSEDSILAGANENGNSAYADTSLVGDNVEDGVLAYITIGVDPSSRHSITSHNYNAVQSIASSNESSSAEEGSSTVDSAGSNVATTSNSATSKFAAGLTGLLVPFALSLF